MYHSNGHYDTYRAVSIRSQGSVGIFLTIRNARNRRLNQVLARLNIFRNMKSQKCPIPQTYSGLVYIRDAGEIWKRRFHSENESTVLRSHCAGEKPSQVILDLWSRKARTGKSRDYRDVIVVFKAGVFKFLQFEERFRKPPFSWRMSVGGGPTKL